MEVKIAAWLKLILKDSTQTKPKGDEADSQLEPK